MTKEELEKEAEEWVISNTEIYDDIFGIEYSKVPETEEAYIAGAEPREKRIEELRAEIQKMKCCGNCFFDCKDTGTCDTCVNYSNWQLRKGGMNAESRKDKAVKR